MNECRFGSFDPEHEGAYCIKHPEIPTSWEYIYENQSILLRADQSGIVNAQAIPPRDIMLVRRTPNDKFSRWQVWIAQEDGTVVSSFGFPRPCLRPNRSEVTFFPEKAVYFSEYENFRVETEVFVPNDGISAVLSVRLTNLGKRQTFSVLPAVEPYVNPAQIAPWDKPEWYLSTSFGKTPSGNLQFCTKLGNNAGEAHKRRFVTFTADPGAESYEIDMTNFTGCGSFDFPDGAGAVLRFPVSEAGEAGTFGERTVYGYPPAYALRYLVSLEEGESRTFTQTLAMQPPESLGVYDEALSRESERLLDRSVRERELKIRKAYFAELFSKRRVRTGDPMFDLYVNSFLPLQMEWVASLDRGWPTGMRGVRDAANDFMGMLAYDPARSEEVLREVFGCQRRDGWLPRQVSTLGAKGTHDLRAYCDGGAFLLELLYETLCYTADPGILRLTIGWLDDGTESTLYEHFEAALGWYLKPENVGEHGLCKIWEGDWLDAVNRAGVNGRGESVTVTAQTVLNLCHAQEILEFVKPEGYEAKQRKYVERAQAFQAALNVHAFNSDKFYNSVFTDGGRWVFSDCDPDGECRMYGPSNYFAIVSGIAGERAEDILKNAERLKCESGYRLFEPAIGKIPLPNVGRIASGDMPAGLWENGNVYNHGSQGFLLRALAACGKGDKFREVLDYLLPYSQTKHPAEETLSPPYAVVNCYQRLPLAMHRGGMPFLTGTIAMAVRAVYEWMFGIHPVPDGLEILPCLPKGKTDCEVTIELRGKRIGVRYAGTVCSDSAAFTAVGDNSSKPEFRRDSAGNLRAFFPEEVLKNGTKITVTF